MGSKKTIFAIIIVIILVMALIAVMILNNIYNQEQLEILTEESNKILQQDLINEDIDTEIKTEGDYAKIELAIKEYLVNLKNIYLNVEDLSSQINIDEIFSVENLEKEDEEDETLEKIDNIINDYKQQSKDYLEEYEELIEEDSIMSAIESVEIEVNKEYYVDLYKTVMLSDTMKKQYSNIENSIENSKDKLYDKLNIVSNIKKYLEEHSKYWSIKDGKIIFTNTNVMVGYYNLINEIDAE